MGSGGAAAAGGRAEHAKIAVRLGLSSRTVDIHVSAILRELDVRIRSEAGAVVEGLAQGWQLSVAVSAWSDLLVLSGAPLCPGRLRPVLVPGEGVNVPVEAVFARAPYSCAFPWPAVEGIRYGSWISAGSPHRARLRASRYAGQSTNMVSMKIPVHDRPGYPPVVAGAVLQAAAPGPRRQAGHRMPADG